MRFTVYLTRGGIPEEGLSPIISIWQITPAGSSANIVWYALAETFTEIGEGFYFYDYPSASVDNDYVATAYESTLTGAEQYAPCISSVEGDIELIRAIEAGRWHIDITGTPHKMVFYNESGTEVKSFDLEQAVTEIPQYVQRTKTI